MPFDLTRRQLIKLSAGLSLTAALGEAAFGEDAPATQPNQKLSMMDLPLGSEKIAILVYPEFTALDALGPYYALAGMMGATVQFVAKTMDPVACEGARNAGFGVRPHIAFADCPRDLDLLLVPGGVTGTINALLDPATRTFLKECADKSKMIGSVCTGALVLGAAGLLKGRRATTHWSTMDLLKNVGATPVKQRVVFDGNDRVTAAGVSAGLDLGFELVKRFRGDIYAQGMQLLGEYDPHPPFPKAGNPDTANPAVVALMNEMHAPLVERFAKAIEKSQEIPAP